MHIVTMQTVSLALQSKRICHSILDTKLHIYMTCIFSHICHFRPMTRPNPLKTQIFDPFPTQPNLRVNPTHGQLCIRLQFDCDSASHGSRIASNRSRIVVVTISCISKSHYGNAASQAARPRTTKTPSHTRSLASSM